MQPTKNCKKYITIYFSIDCKYRRLTTYTKTPCLVCGQVRVGISQEVEKYLINWFSNFAANVFQNNWMARNLWKNNNKARRNRSLYLISLKAYRLVTFSLLYTYLKVRRYMLRSISNVLWKGLSGSGQYIGSSKPCYSSNDFILLNVPFIKLKSSLK